MEVEKRSSKQGFLHLFDWNLKSRKKLFSSNKSELAAENGKNVEEYVDRVAIPRIQQVHENGGVHESKAINDLHHQAAPSTSEECGHEAKMPGVVARLMGLDYMPNSNASDYDTLPFKSQLFSRADYLRSLDFHDEHHIVIYESSLKKANRMPRNPLELKLQKMQKPIEKFQTEVLPSKTAKPVSISHSRQMSPIKSPGFIPPKNAAFVMEAAARITENSPRSTAKGKSSSLVSSSSTLRFHELTEKIGAPKKTSTMSDATNLHHPNKHLKRQPRKKGDVHLTSRVSTVAHQNQKTKDKPAPLAVKAKSTVQRRDAMTSFSRTSGNAKEASETKPSYSLKNLPNSRKNVEKKTSSSRSSGVLRQSNQTQNYMTHKDEESSKPSLSANRKDRKVLPTSDINRKNKVLNKVIVNPTARSGTTNSMVVNSSRDSSEFRIKNVSRKKLPESTDTYSVKSTENSTREKPVRCNVSSGGQNGLDVIDRKTGLDVVSFTFTSPINKLFPGSSSSTHSTENNESSCRFTGENDSSSKFSAASCSGISEVGGDALSILLEQKLRELISNVEDPLQEDKEMTSTSSNQCNPCTDEIRPSGPWDWKGSESVEHTSFRKNESKRNFDLLNSSLPPSQNILASEASCNSLDSYQSFTSAVSGSQWCSSFENEDVSDQSSAGTSQITNVDLDLTDSACSSSTWSISMDNVSSFTLSTSKGPYHWELEYIKNIINHADLMLEEFALGHVHQVMDPNLFDHLETHITESNKNLEDQFRIARRALFDCVEECLQSRCKRNFCGSFRAWSKWLAVFKRSDHLAEDLYREIFSLTNMADLMVDHLVDKDMSSQGGRWIEFEYETFEEGIEMENEILTSLVDELLGDFVVSI